MKKIAIRGLVILALVVAFSIFFAQTIITISTPKVKIATARKGVLEYAVPLKGRIAFEGTRPYTPEEIIGKTVVIDYVAIALGDFVTAGQVIAQISPPQETLYAIAGAKEDFRVAQAAYLKNEADFPTLAKHTDSDKNNVIREAEIALDGLMVAQEKFIAAAAEMGFPLGADSAAWETEILSARKYGLLNPVRSVQAAQEAVNIAIEQCLNVFTTSKTKREVVDFIENRVALKRSMDSYQRQLVTLLIEAESLKTIVAPHEGYIVELNLEAGKMYDGFIAAVVLSVSSEPVIKCDLSGIEKHLSPGMKAEIKDQLSGGKIMCEVYKEVYGGYQQKDLLIALEQDDLIMLGGLYTLLKANPEIEVTILYRSEQARTLLPISTVRTEGNDIAYVYCIEKGSNFWGTTLTVRRQYVRVLERGEKDIAVLEDLGGKQLADKEDRAIADGMTVMEYMN